MVTVQSDKGKIILWEDFTGKESPVALTNTTEQFGDFRLIGDGIADTDSGIVTGESDPCLSGVGVFTTTDEDKHCCGLATPLMFDVAKMAPIILEARVQFDDEDTKGYFMGLSSANGDDLALEDDVVQGTATTLTLTATNFVGFYWSSELTDDADWHAVYNGGTTACSTNSANQDLDDDLVAGEWQVIKLEVDNNGDARWYIDGVLLKSVSTAVSTTADLAAVFMVEDKNNTSAGETAAHDYCSVEANRDWTV